MAKKIPSDLEYLLSFGRALGVEPEDPSLGGVKLSDLVHKSDNPLMLREDSELERILGRKRAAAKPAPMPEAARDIMDELIKAPIGDVPTDPATVMLGGRRAGKSKVLKALEAMSSGSTFTTSAIGPAPVSVEMMAKAFDTLGKAVADGSKPAPDTTWQADDAVQRIFRDHLDELNAAIAETTQPGHVLEEQMTLTVKNADGSFKNKGHIGGESFALIGIRKGKRVGLIAEFRPLEAAAYAAMEMPLDKAIATFPGFEKFLLGTIASLKLPSFEEKELEANPDKYEDFGSW